MPNAMFNDPSDVDLSVVASLPIDVRREVEREMRLVKHQQEKKKLSQKKKKRKQPSYRQAKETKEGAVEVLCFACRRDPQKKRQPTLARFWEKAATTTTTNEKTTVHNNDGELFCARCRVPLQQTKRQQCGGTNKVVSVLPQSTRLKGYKRLAKETGVPFALTDSEAMKLMRESCFGCGQESGPDGNGISRLRNWTGFPASAQQSAKKPFMGPFTRSNCVAACAVCNLMKGHRSIPSFVEACRTIATHRGSGTASQDYGRYPHRFRDNVSRRSRSSYITKSSTHTKTHCLTNEQFRAIVARPCAYCGKPPSDTHHNGLDRLDSDNRVYSIENVVSCCGDCNIMKYQHSLSFFLGHCKRVAEHHRGTTFEHEEEEEKEKNAKDCVGDSEDHEDNGDDATASDPSIG